MYVVKTGCLAISVQDVVSNAAKGVDSTSLFNYYHLLFQR